MEESRQLQDHLLSHCCGRAGLSRRGHGRSGGGPTAGKAIQWGPKNRPPPRFDVTSRPPFIQGSGWGWLGYNKASDRLEVVTTANQDPLSTTVSGGMPDTPPYRPQPPPLSLDLSQGLVPLLGVDVWEHAYYLDYKNVRPDYLKAVWNVVNWSDVEGRLAAAKK